MASFVIKDVMKNTIRLFILLALAIPISVNAFAEYIAEGDIVGDGSTPTIFADQADAKVTINNGTVWSTTEFTKFANKADFTLNLESGAQMNFSNVYGSFYDDTDVIIRMSGAGTKFTSSGFFIMNGHYGNPALVVKGTATTSVHLSDGAEMDMQFLWFGKSSPNTYADLTVTGNSTKITCANSILAWNGEFNFSILDSASVYSEGNSSIMMADASFGNFVIDNASWQNAYNGSNGLLRIGGGLSGDNNLGHSDVTIKNSGILHSYQLITYENVSIAGDGTIKTDDSFENYGTFKPGNGVGTFNIDGDYTHKTKARLEAQLADNTNDLLHITEDAVLEGGQLKLSVVGEITASKTMTVLQADNSLTGTFDTVTPFEETQFLKYDGITYDANSVKVDVVKKADFIDIATEEREESIAKALDNLVGSNDTDTSTVLGAIQQLKTIEQVKQAYKEVAGSDRTSIVSATLDNMSSYMGSISSRIHSSSGQSNLLAGVGLRSLNESHLVLSYGRDGMYAPYNRWGLWAQAYGVRTDMESNDLFEGYQAETQGYSMGLDTKLNKNLTLGLAYGYATSDIDYVGSDFGDVHSENYSLYASFAEKNYYTDFMLSYAKNNNKASRHVQFGSIDRIAESDYDSTVSSAYVETGINIKAGETTVTPAISLQVASVDTEQYDETGADSLNLSYDSNKVDSYKMALALELSREIIAKRNKSLSASIKLKVDHEFGDKRQIQVAHLGGSQGQDIELNGRDISRDTITVGTSLKAKTNENTQVSLDYSYSLNEDLDSHYLGLLLKYLW